MKTTKITEEEIKDLKIASLPTRPTADKSFGGKGFSSSDMRAAFDKLPLFIIERFNALIDDLFEDEGIGGEIRTGISESHTLNDLFTDITDGMLASYLAVGERTLSEYLSSLEARIAALEGGSE